MLIRAIQTQDLEDFYKLAMKSGFGLTSLPRERELLRRKIEHARSSFNREVYKPGGENYLFVMENQNGRLVGACAILARVGGYEPWYGYKLETAIRESKSLGVKKENRYLKLSSEHSGPTLIGTLLLLPEFRKRGVGRFLSLSRFLFMAEFPELFTPNICAEMRGVSDTEGRSPFWDGLGKNFFEMAFPVADHQSAIDKRFIAELMPEHPIYLSMLSEEAQKVIGQVHEDTKGALKILEGEGFRSNGMIDIFDGGPQVHCPLKEIRIVTRSRRVKLSEIDKSPDKEGPGEPAGQYIVSAWGPDNNKKDFRSCRTDIRETPEGPALPEKVARRLEIKPGDEIRYAPLYSQ